MKKVRTEKSKTKKKNSKRKKKKHKKHTIVSVLKMSDYKSKLFFKKKIKVVRRCRIMSSITWLEFFRIPLFTYATQKYLLT